MVTVTEDGDKGKHRSWIDSFYYILWSTICVFSSPSSGRFAPLPFPSGSLIFISQTCVPFSPADENKEPDREGQDSTGEFFSLPPPMFSYHFSLSGGHEFSGTVRDSRLTPYQATQPCRHHKYKETKRRDKVVWLDRCKRLSRKEL